jgi:hypothetical protein
VRTCRLLGHRYRFVAEGPVMRWTCRRGCGAGGEKTYDSADAAARYASVLDRDPVDDLGRRGPLIGLLPLRIARWLRRRHGRRSDGRSLQPR